jgi:hypothetical protein
LPPRHELPETGIVDSHRYMLALEGDLEDHGGVIALNTSIERLVKVAGGWEAYWERRSAVDHRRRGGQLGGARRAKLGRATEGYPPERCPGSSSGRAAISALPAGRCFHG